MQHADLTHSGVVLTVGAAAGRRYKQHDIELLLAIRHRSNCRHALRARAEAIQSMHQKRTRLLASRRPSQRSGAHLDDDCAVLDVQAVQCAQEGATAQLALERQAAGHLALVLRHGAQRQVEMVPHAGDRHACAFASYRCTSSSAQLANFIVLERVVRYARTHALNRLYLSYFHQFPPCRVTMHRHDFCPFLILVETSEPGCRMCRYGTVQEHPIKDRSSGARAHASWSHRPCQGQTRPVRSPTPRPPSRCSPTADGQPHSQYRGPD